MGPLLALSPVGMDSSSFGADRAIIKADGCPSAETLPLQAKQSGAGVRETGQPSSR